MDKKNTTEEKTREEVEAERKAKRVAKQDRKKAALEKHKSDGPDTKKKPVDQPLESAKVHKTVESKPVSRTYGTYFSFNVHCCCSPPKIHIMVTEFDCFYCALL